MKRIPIFPTLLVLIAVGVMVRLGFWQLDRLHQKEALLAQYAAAEQEPPLILETPPESDLYLFRRVTVPCGVSKGGGMIAGRNAKGEPGWAHVKNCYGGAMPDPRSANGVRPIIVPVVIGWSHAPIDVNWKGGAVTGTIAPGAGKTVRIIADPPFSGLEANALPDPANVPNNHLSYAVQWFLFALTALVIYGLALRKRLAA